MSDKVTVRVTHRFQKPAEKVFDAWLDAKTAGKWLFATSTGTITRCEIDGRVGGKFNIVRREGGQDIAHVGEYLEIDRPRRIVFSFGVPAFSKELTTVTIDIAPAGTGCELRLTHEGVPPDYAERNVEGWTMILGNLAQMLG